MLGSNKKKIEKKNRLNLTMREIPYGGIKESEINPQQMTATDFDRLVKNIERDGALSSVPLIEEKNGEYICISGHHRIKAAIKAGLSGGNCLIAKDIDESTRTRLQLAHNDIHGTPDKDLVALLSKKLTDLDIGLIDTSDLEDKVKEAQEVDVSVPTFRYINICLMDQSREELTDMIMSLEKKSDDINWLVTKEQYKDVIDLIEYAFDHNFKTPGQAFGRFLDIIKENKELIKR